MPFADPDKNVAGLALKQFREASARQVNKLFDLSFSIKACFAEFICMVRGTITPSHASQAPQTLFVFIGTATAMGNSPTYAVGGPIRFKAATGGFGDTDGALQEGFLAPLQTTGNWGLTVALAFGYSITVLVYAIAHISGGQLNPAVSLALFITGRLPPVQVGRVAMIWCHTHF